MPLKKLQLKPGVNRENTRYTNEGGWYESDKVRFRQGTPEKIGGWQRLSASTFLGVCRSLWDWVLLNSLKIIGVGTSVKFYLSIGGAYNDITPIRTQTALTNPFTTVSGSRTVTVTDATGGFANGDYVTFYGATAVGGLTLNGEYQITVVGTPSTTYTIRAASSASSSTTGGGTVYAVYQINSGPTYQVPTLGWGFGEWGIEPWGMGPPVVNPTVAPEALRLWSQANFGEDLIFGPRGGGVYYWDATGGYSPITVTASVAAPTVITSPTVYPEGTPVRFVPATGVTMPTGMQPGKLYYVRNLAGSTFNISLTPTGSLVDVTVAGTGTIYMLTNAYALVDMTGASDVPLMQNYLSVSDSSRFVFAFGCNDYGSTTQDPMLIRWSDQEDAINWTPSITNQAGSLRLSHGSKIVTSAQSRQEVLVWTDTSLYSMQYAGPPIVWGAQLVGDTITIASQNAVAFSGGVAYWMGKDKFYRYDGRTQPLSCDLRKFVFQDLNPLQYEQVFAGTNSGFNEIWWFYCSAASNTIDRYVVYNYMENVWYYGTMSRTAWLDSALAGGPIAATYSSNIVAHEIGTDDGETAITQPITAYITSAEFDLDDGHNFMFIWRVLPDVTFAGSQTENPALTLYMLPLKNSGSGYAVSHETDANHSVAGSSYANVVRAAEVPVEEFTGQVYTRVRGRQMAIKVQSSALGVAWQLGAPRLDMRPDGRR